MGQKTNATPAPQHIALPAQQNLFTGASVLRAPVRPMAATSARMTRPVVMSASHGLNKTDKKFIRDMNSKMYQTGAGENLMREDVANPSIRHALHKVAGHRQLSGFEHDQIIEMAQKKNYARVE